MTAVAELTRGVYRGVVGATTLAALVARGRSAPPDCPPRVFYGGARSGNLGGPLVKVAQLQSVFPEHRFDFSVVYLLSNALYLPTPVMAKLRRCGVPIVVNQNGVYFPAWYPNGYERENARIGRALEAAEHVMFQSSFCKSCVSRFVGVEPRSSEILHNSVDTEVFTPRAPDRADHDRHPVTFLLTGKIGDGSAYRLNSAIRGLAAARKGGLDVTLDIAGHIAPGAIRETEREVAKLGVDRFVRLLGPYGRSAAPDIYRSADAYISTTHNDACPNAVLEAMASGLPVLHLSSGGVPELVGPHAGVSLTVPQTFEAMPVPEPDRIAEGMAEIVARRGPMSAAARKRAVERFSFDRWLARHAEVFSATLAKNSSL